MTRVILYSSVVAALIVMILVALFNEKSEIERVYDLAGDNAKELKTVIEHFKKEDSLKYGAARFLVKGLPYHFTNHYSWLDKQNNKVEIVPRDYKSREKINEFIQSKGLEFRRDTFAYHPESIKSKYLIDNIELAFEAWEQLPWKDSVSFNDFKEYILPYCLGSELTEEWRLFFRLNHGQIKDSIYSKSDPIKVAKYITKIFDVWRWYNDNASFLTNHQSCSELFRYRCVECINYAHLIVMACRSFGIAAAVDEIPLWGNRNSSHCECSVLAKDGKWHGLGDHGVWSDVYYDGRRVSKVFKRTYSRQDWTLASKVKNKKKLPPLLQNECYIDATPDYCPAQNIDIRLDTIIKNEKYVYSCVFNNNRWQAVHWAKMNKDDSVCFTNMAPYVVYLPSFYIDYEYVPASNPVIVDTSGKVNVFNIDYNRLQSFEVSHWELSHKLNKSIQNGDKVYLYIWKNSWEYFSQGILKENLWVFNDVPSNTIFKVESMKAGDRPRIFSVEDNKVNWW